MNQSATISEIAPHVTVPKGTFAEAAVQGTFNIAFSIQGFPRGISGTTAAGRCW